MVSLGAGCYLGSQFDNKTTITHGGHDLPITLESHSYPIDEVALFPVPY